jgi:dihydrofolate reductase
LRRIIAISQVSVDGVMQGPGGPEEDPSNGFTHGGWAMPFVDDAVYQNLVETVADEFDMLLGRWTYRLLAETGRQLDYEGVQQGDEIRRHAQPRPTRLEEVATHRR